MTALSPSQIADRWNVSESHVRKMIADGKLPFFRLMSLYRVKLETIERVEAGECVSSFSEENGTPPSRPQPVSGERRSERQTVRKPQGGSVASQSPHTIKASEALEL